MSQVILFSTSSCPWCKRAKRYLKENRVRFKEVNIDVKSYYAKSALPSTFKQ